MTDFLGDLPTRSWRGACDGMSPDVFFVDGKEHEANLARKAAQAVCKTECEYRVECLDEGFMYHERYGIRGGLCERQLRIANHLHLREVATETIIEMADNGTAPFGRAGRPARRSV